MLKSFATQILLILAMLQDLTCLRLNKISIPAYKLRGESTFLECHYELDRSGYMPNTNNRRHHSIHHVINDSDDGGRGGGIKYFDTASMTGEEPKSPIYYGTSMQQKQRFNRQNNQQQPQSYHYFNSGEGIATGHRRPDLYQMQQYQTQTSLERSRWRGEKMGWTGISWQESKNDASKRLSSGAYAIKSKEGRKSVNLAENGGVVGHGRTNNDYDIGGDDDDDDNYGSNNSNSDQEDDSEALYAVKWYKDNEEFYRYVPKANPPKQSYRVDGVRVIEEHSDSTRVLLRGLTINSTGVYRCEVSAEAPNFSSVQGEGRMDIVYLPRDGPHIRGQQFEYQTGETLNLNCSSGKSHPASHLQWYINDQPVSDTQFLIPYNITVHKHGLITSTLGLRLVVDATHFLSGTMRVKCVASISPVLWKGDKESVLQHRSAIIDNREAMLLVRNRVSRLHSSQRRHILITSALTFTLFVYGLTRRY